MRKRRGHVAVPGIRACTLFGSLGPVRAAAAAGALVLGAALAAQACSGEPNGKDGDVTSQSGAGAAHAGGAANAGASGPTGGAGEGAFGAAGSEAGGAAGAGAGSGGTHEGTAGASAGGGAAGGHEGGAPQGGGGAGGAGGEGGGGGGAGPQVCGDLDGVWEGKPDTCDGPAAARCEAIATKKNEVVLIDEVLVADYASCADRNVFVVKFVDPQACGTVNYPCGDIRKGGLDPAGPQEKWVGSICETYDLGNGTFELHLDKATGSKKFKLAEGKAVDTYVWYQCCDPQYPALCGWW